MTLMGCTDQRGGVTSAISTALMPRAHTSTYITPHPLSTCLLLLLHHCSVCALGLLNLVLDLLLCCYDAQSKQVLQQPDSMHTDRWCWLRQSLHQQQ